MNENGSSKVDINTKDQAYIQILIIAMLKQSCSRIEVLGYQLKCGIFF